MIKLLLINCSNSLRLTSFFVPTKRTKGQFGIRSIRSSRLIPMLLYSAASLIVSAAFRWIGTFSISDMLNTTLQIPVLKPIGLKDCTIPGDKATPGILGDQVGGTGVVQNDLGQHVIRPTTDPKIQIIFDLARNDRSVRALSRQDQMYTKGPAQPCNGRQLAFYLRQRLLT